MWFKQLSCFGTSYNFDRSFSKLENKPLSYIKFLRSSLLLSGHNFKSVVFQILAFCNFSSFVFCHNSPLAQNLSPPPPSPSQVPSEGMTLLCISILCSLLVQHFYISTVMCLDVYHSLNRWGRGHSVSSVLKVAVRVCIRHQSVLARLTSNGRREPHVSST